MRIIIAATSPRVHCPCGSRATPPLPVSTPALTAQLIGSTAYDDTLPPSTNPPRDPGADGCPAARYSTVAVSSRLITRLTPKSSP